MKDDVWVVYFRICLFTYLCGDLDMENLVTLGKVFIQITLKTHLWINIKYTNIFYFLITDNWHSQVVSYSKLFNFKYCYYLFYLLIIFCVGCVWCVLVENGARIEGKGRWQNLRILYTQGLVVLTVYIYIYIVTVSSSTVYYRFIHWQCPLGEYTAVIIYYTCKARFLFYRYTVILSINLCFRFFFNCCRNNFMPCKKTGKFNTRILISWYYCVIKNKVVS